MSEHGSSQWEILSRCNENLLMMPRKRRNRNLKWMQTNQMVTTVASQQESGIGSAPHTQISVCLSRPWYIWWKTWWRNPQHSRERREEKWNEREVTSFYFNYTEMLMFDCFNLLKKKSINVRHEKRDARKKNHHLSHCLVSASWKKKRKWRQTYRH